MRAELKKFLFVGAKEKMELFFQEAQTWGVIHFSGKASGQCLHANAIQKIVAALKMLPTSSSEEPYQEGAVDKLLQLKERAAALELELAKLAQELAFAPCFGRVSFADLQAIECASGTAQWHFYWAMKDFCIDDPSLILVNSDAKRKYFMALTAEPSNHPKLHPVPLKQCQKQAELEFELNGVKEGIAKLAHQRQGLKVHLAAQINTSTKNEALRKAYLSAEDAIFAAPGWVPEKEAAGLYGKVDALGVHMLPVAQETDETPPTLLENSALGQMGEDLVNIYDTPSATDTDPSLWVIAFFALFFAFIIGDGGYGLVFLGSALFVRWKYTLGQEALRAWRIAATVSAACIVWGLLTTSFFGMPIAQESPLRKFSVLQWAVEKRMAYQGELAPQAFLGAHPEIYARTADQIMLELALLIGIVHLSISLIRYAGRNPPSIGWLIFLWSAALYTPRYLEASTVLDDIFHVPAVLFEWAPYGMGIGIVVATLLSLVKNRWLGLLEFTTVLQLFGDSLSYLRLYALALAGSMLTGALMELSASTNIVLGTFILIVGHLGNMVLSIMGGLIHGLRLNFLEWYHYSFEGGGKPYQPLRRMT